MPGTVFVGLRLMTTVIMRMRMDDIPIKVVVHMHMGLWGRQTLRGNGGL